MTQDEIIDMARQVWLSDYGVQTISHGGEVEMDLEALEAFAKLVASAAIAKEREACAKICEEEAWRLKKIAVDTNSPATNNRAIQASNDADAIRARGEQQCCDKP